MHNGSAGTDYTKGGEMYHRILVPLDGSPLSEIALPYAEELARGLGSSLVLLLVTGSAEAHDYNEQQIYIEKVVEAIERRDEGHEERHHRKPVKVESTVLVGDPAEQIADFAEREDISLVVMATHGRSGIRRWALGSVADKVVRATTRPVMLITPQGTMPEVR